jgi:hypothetical protein
LRLIKKKINGKIMVYLNKLKIEELEVDMKYIRKYVMNEKE